MMDFGAPSKPKLFVLVYTQPTQVGRSTHALDALKIILQLYKQCNILFREPQGRKALFYLCQRRLYVFDSWKQVSSRQHSNFKK